MTTSRKNPPHEKIGSPSRRKYEPGSLQLTPALTLWCLGSKESGVGLCGALNISQEEGRYLLLCLEVPLIEKSDGAYFNLAAFEKIMFYLLDVGGPGIPALMPTASLECSSDKQSSLLRMKKYIDKFYADDDELQQRVGINMMIAATCHGYVDRVTIVSRLKNFINRLSNRRGEMSKETLNPGGFRERERTVVPD